MAAPDLLRQSALLNAMVQILHDEAQGVYESVELTFSHDPAEGWAETSFAVTRGGDRLSLTLSPKGHDQTVDLATELFEAMKDQTGSAWTSVVIAYPALGSATVRFSYGLHSHQK